MFTFRFVPEMRIDNKRHRPNKKRQTIGESHLLISGRIRLHGIYFHCKSPKPYQPMVNKITIMLLAFGLIVCSYERPSE